MKVKIPKTVAIVELDRAPFRNAREARAWAKSHGIVGVMSSVDTGGKGEVSIYDGSRDGTKAYSYEISNIEILKGNAAPVARPNNRTSMSTGILLNGVCNVNGRPILAVGAQNPNKEGK